MLRFAVLEAGRPERLLNASNGMRGELNLRRSIQWRYWITKQWPMDRVDSKTRSKIMASVRSRNTGAEMRVRSLVHRMGYRFSLRRLDLPGKPDLVFPQRHKAIFVHGCFWHGHKCRYGKPPKSRQDYWIPKIAANKARDTRQSAELRRLGWSVLTVWQCEVRNSDRLSRRMAAFLHG